MADGVEKAERRRPVEAWEHLLNAVLAMPGVRVDRAEYLRVELSKHVAPDVVTRAIETTPARAKIDPDVIGAIASGSIAWHRAGVSALSFAAGLPGGLWALGTIPADLAQYFYHVLVIAQKLAYLYGWPEIFEGDGELEDQTRLILSIFVGVMMGSEVAATAISQLATAFSGQFVKRVPSMALTKYAIYNLAKQVAKWIGINLTKTKAAEFLAKGIPVLGGFISGTVTWISFSTMAGRLQAHLSQLPLASDTEA